MNNSVTFSTFTVLFKQHLYLVPKYFHHPQRKLYTCQVVAFHPRFLPVPGHHQSAFVSVDLPTLDI